MADNDTKLAPATPAPAAPEAGGVDPHAVAMSPEAEAYRKALELDWTEWVAATDIRFGNVLSYAEGDPVPATNVKRWKYDEQGLVEKRSSKAGKDILARTEARTPSTIKAPGDD